MGKCKTKLFAIFGFTLLILSVLSPLAPPKAYAAAAPVTYWVNNQMIYDVTNNTYYYASTEDNLNRSTAVPFYSSSTDANGCSDYIVPAYNHDKGSLVSQYFTGTPATGVGASGCVYQSTDINIGDPNNQQLLFVWQNSSTIIRYPFDNQPEMTYTVTQTDGTTFLSSTSCGDYLVFAPTTLSTKASYYAQTATDPTTSSDTNIKAGYVETTTSGEGVWGNPHELLVHISPGQQINAGSNCYGSNLDENFKPVTVTVTLQENNTANGSIPISGSGGVPNSTTGGTSDACLSWNPISWILCPIILGAGEAISVGDNMVQSLLVINPSDYGQNLNGHTVNPVQTAWSAFRIIASILVVAIALFMIISQIIGYEFFDAYTIKKVLPRLVIAVILIQLSWVLIIGAIDLVNLIGQGVQSLLTAPFGIPPGVSGIVDIIQQNGTFKGAGGVASTGTLFLGVSVAIILSSAGAGMLFGLVALAIAVIIAIMIVIITLIIRKLLIVALLIIAPLAILAFILPNTQSWWKKWWSNLSKLLLMFPLIMGLLAVGKDFAWIAASTNSETTSTITFFIILIAYFGPFFFIPSTFKWGGTMMTAASGAIAKNGGKLKKGIMDSSPMKNFQKSSQQNKISKGMNRSVNGRNGLSRMYGRMQAGTFGATGEYAKVLRAQEKARIEKEAEQQAEVDYATATRGQSFKEYTDEAGATHIGRMEEAEAFMRLNDGDPGSLNGREVKMNRAMRNKVFSELVNGKQDDAVRRSLKELTRKQKILW